jgi:hypothetical protein
VLLERGATSRTVLCQFAAPFLKIGLVATKRAPTNKGPPKFDRILVPFGFGLVCEVLSTRIGSWIASELVCGSSSRVFVGLLQI